MSGSALGGEVTLYDGKTGVEFIPCAYQRKFIRWGPRGSNGGFKGEYAPELVDEMHQRGQLVELDNRLLMPLPDGTVETLKLCPGCGRTST